MSTKYLDATGLSYFWQKIKNYITKVDSSNSPYIVGTQTASTNAWKGNAPFATLTAGQQIRYYLPYAGTSTAATLNLTLSDGTTTGAIALRRLATSTVTTQFAAGCVLYLTYDGTYWKTSAYYDTNTNTIGYQLRTNSSNRTAYEKGYRYRLWFTSADRTKWIPANISTSTNATTARTANTTPIDPFGDIIYNSTNDSVVADAALATGTQWQQYAITLGYSFTDALPLIAGTPVYLKCLPNTNGSAVMQGTTQTLPSTNDGFIYIYLGQAYSTTQIELRATHPIYWHDGTGIRIWTGASSGAETDPVFTASAAHGITSTDISNWNSKQDALVSGTSIKTLNSTSLLGSGNITITEGLTPLIGASGDITPSAVATALEAGKDICISHSGSLLGVALNLEFTSWNRATDTDYGGAAIDVVVSQTIAYYTGNYYLFELVGLVGDGTWTLFTDKLATPSDIPTNVSALNNDSGFITLADLPIYNGGVS